MKARTDGVDVGQPLFVTFTIPYIGTYKTLSQLTQRLIINLTK